MKYSTSAPRLLTGLAVFLVLVLSVSFSSNSVIHAAPAPAISEPLMPLSDIQPGMKGVGKTVFEGTRIEEFQADILGVLKNVSPGQSLILARLSGGPLEKTGVLAGMSGSPVYIDGKLIGAVAMTFQFIKEPIAGITPIEQMIESSQNDEAAAPAPKSAASAWSFSRDVSTGELRLLMPDAKDTAKLAPPEQALGNRIVWGGADTSLLRVATPLVLSGFTSQAIESFQPQFQALGLVPVQGGGISGGSSGDSSKDIKTPPAKIEPGSMISVQLVRGDMGVSADGTVTVSEGNRIFAFGHPFLSAGPMEIPFGESTVIASVPGLATSMKVTTPGRLLGVIQKDESSGIFGLVGEQGHMIPVDFELVSQSGSSHSYHFEVANDRYLLPFLLNLTVFSAVGATERQVGDSTLQLNQTISLAGLPEIKLENFIAGGANGPAAAAKMVATPLAYLMQSGLGPLDVKAIHLRMVSSNQRLAQDLEQVWTSKREVKAGDKVQLTALMRDQDGHETLQHVSVEIPSSIPPGPLTITVADGGTLDRLEASAGGGRQVMPKDPQQLVRAINRSRTNNRLYVRLARPEAGFVLQGLPFPSPPPSVVSTLNTDPSLSFNVSRTMLSTVADFELDPVPGVVEGAKALGLSVVE